MHIENAHGDNLNQCTQNRAKKKDYELHSIIVCIEMMHCRGESREKMRDREMTKDNTNANIQVAKHREKKTRPVARRQILAKI